MLTFNFEDIGISKIEIIKGRKYFNLDMQKIDGDLVNYTEMHLEEAGIKTEYIEIFEEREIQGKTQWNIVGGIIQIDATDIKAADIIKYIKEIFEKFRVKELGL